MKTISFAQAIKSINYHPKLIQLSIEGLNKGALLANVLIPLCFLYIFYDYVPISILSIWVLSHFFIAYLRYILGQKMKEYNESKDPKVKKYVRYNIYVVTVNGMLWGVASIISFIYAPIIYLFYTFTFVAGLNSGASTTLSTIFHAYLGFVFFSMTPILFCFALLEHGYIMFFLFLLFMSFIFHNGYIVYRNIVQNIMLHDKLITQNENLEDKVNQRTCELNELNSSLEKRIKKEVELSRNKDQKLIQQSRMAQMGEMISMIAHQWRQPLTAISSTASALKMKSMLGKFDLNDKGQNYFNTRLEEIENYVQSLTTTIDDFRNFYKPNKSAKVINLKQPLQKALNIIKNSIEVSDIKITLSCNSNKQIKLHDNEMMQVFLNILKNAQDNFRDKNIANPYIKIETSDTKDGVKIVFSDNGGGIPKDIISKIFDPYFSTKDDKNGTGLGLYMCKTIIEEHHNGKLYANNTQNGVEFVIKMPSNFSSHI